MEVLLLTSHELEHVEVPLKSVSSSTLDHEDSFPLKAVDTDEPFFNDGTRHIDYILVYKEENDETKRDKRHTYVSNIKKAGFQVEQNVSGNTHYIKLHATWDVLATWAEQLQILLPVQANVATSEDDSWDIFFSPFKKDKLDRYIGQHDKQTLFSTRERQYICHHILSVTSYGSIPKAETGLDKLISEEGLSDAFPLHDGPYKKTWKHTIQEDMNSRQKLYDRWVSWSSWYKTQPLDLIRHYLGETVSFYSAWIGFYIRWLLLPAILGIGVFICGIMTLNYDSASNEVCTSGKEYRMCPLCDERIGCGYWYLSRLCHYARAAHVVDNYGTALFTLFMSVWGILFVESWKRKLRSLSYQWGTIGQQFTERLRPEYSLAATSTEISAITGDREPRVHNHCYWVRMLPGWVITVLMIVVVLLVTTATFLYSTVVGMSVFQSRFVHGRAFFLSGSTASILNFAVIAILEKLFNVIAWKITLWERHRTDTEFQRHLAIKLVTFQLFNYFSTALYIVHIKGRFVGYPRHYSRILGLRLEECQAGSCSIDLAMHLGVLVIGRILLRQLEGVIHSVYKQCGKKIRSREENTKKRWLIDEKLDKHCDLHQEYMDMVLRFGLATLFVSAFPLAPALVMLHSSVALRQTAAKLLCKVRRRVQERCHELDSWVSALSLLAHLAIISHACVLAFSSDLLPKLLYKFTRGDDLTLTGFVEHSLALSAKGAMSHPCRFRGYRDHEGNFTAFFWQLMVFRLAFILLYEHIVLLICRIISSCTPTISHERLADIRRQHYLNTRLHK